MTAEPQAKPTPAATSASLATFYEQLANARLLANEGRLEEAREHLRALADGRVQATFGHGEAGELAAELGMAGLAERELQLAIRDNRGFGKETLWMARLADLYADLDATDKELLLREKLRDRGDESQSARIDALHQIVDTPVTLPKPLRPEGEAERAVESATRPSEDVPTEASRPEGSKVNASGRVDVSRLVMHPPGAGDLARFLQLFQGRGDVHARQWINRDGRSGYNPIERPLTFERLQSHLDCHETLGVYQVREDRTVLFFAIDLDVTKNALHRARQSREEGVSLRRRLHLEGLRLRDKAAELGLSLILEDSGYKGRHLWGFLRDPLPIGMMRNFVRSLGRLLHPEDPDLAIECFPKQDRLRDDQLGNLIKLPLGIHLRSGRRAWLLDERGLPAENPWPLLRGVPLLDREAVLDALERMRDYAARQGDDDPEPDRFAGAPVAPPPPEFEVEDFEKDPELSTVLARCNVMRHLVERGLERRRLSHDEQTVIRHVLGHRANGVRGVNFLFRRCPEIPPENHLKSRLNGYAMSCPKIRRRVPDVTEAVVCNCDFRFKPDHYPSPLLHIEHAQKQGLYPVRVKLRVPEPEPARKAQAAVKHEAPPGHPLPAAEAPAAPLDTQAAQEALSRALVAVLQAIPDGRLPMQGGVWSLRGQGESAEAVWTAGGGGA